MDVSCATITRPDDNSTEEFIFEIPVTNIKLQHSDAVDISYITDEVTVKFEACDTEINSKDAVTWIDSGTIVIDECENDNISKVNKVEIDDENKSSALTDAGNAHEAKSVNDNNLQELQSANKESRNATVLEAIRSKNAVIEVDAKKKHKDKKEIDALPVDNIVTNNSIVLDTDLTESAMNLDEAESENVIVLDGNKTDSETTIIIDDDELKKLKEKYPSNPIVIDVDTDCSIVESTSTVKREKDKAKYDEVYKENSLLAELIEKCLDMENTDGMSRVINRTLLAIYKDVDVDYKKSDALRKVITRVIMSLEIEPERKFSHLKNFCDELKDHRVKKRVQFITLKARGDNDHQSISGKSRKRRRVETIIDLDDENISQNHQTQNKTTIQNNKSQRKEYAPIEIDDDSNSDVLINDGDDVILLDTKNNSNKEKDKKKRLKKKGTRKTHKKKRGRPRKSNSSSNIVRNPFHVSNCTSIGNPIDNSNTGQDKDIIPSTSDAVSQIEPSRNSNTDQDIIPTISDPGELLQPRGEGNMFMMEFNQQKIKHIENEIACLKERLEKLEECEVTTDCNMSPYIISEQVKATIVNLYKELCQLTGTEVTKRHEVRLQVVPGHPHGPVLCLEEFLNDNIDKDGNPPFPDMHDVVQCVCEANVRYNLKWGRPQIMSEAHALFIQFGRSMQKRRQKREWKDLMSRVKHEAPDPAEDDLTLQERLLKNSMIARRNEDELLERFVKMEHGLTQPDPELRLSIVKSDSDEESDVDAPDPGNGLSTVDPRVAASGLSTEETPSDCVIGSTLTVSAGNIVIQPIVKYGIGPNQTLPKTIPQKAVALNPDISLYSSEFQRFIYDTQDKSKNHLNNRFVTKTKSVPKKNIRSKKLSKESSNMVQSTQSTQKNENDLANAANFAKEILSLVLNDSPKANGLAKEKNNNFQTNQCAELKSFNPTVKLTNLNLKNLLANKCNVNNLENLSLKVNISNLECKQNDKIQTEDEFQIFTHTTKCKGNVIESTDLITDCNNEIPDCKELNTTCRNVDKEIKQELVSEVFKDKERSQTENVDSNTDENVKDIVKPEPLDIPSMLEELGEDFTATIFDIEDPFLVIEISDSSESEDEEM